jgi:hypothetical protein
MAALSEIAVTDQPLIHPAELCGDFPDSGSTDGAFVHAGGLLVQVVNHGAYRAPMVAGGGPSERGQLVTTIRLRAR